MEMEKHTKSAESRTKLSVCVGILSVALVASLALSFYTLISLNLLSQSYDSRLQMDSILRNQNENLDREKRYIGTAETNISGAIYTRWGNLGCREGTSLIYAGEVATAYFNSKGGTNYLCLPSGGMEWLAWNTAVGVHSYIMGTDYQTSLYGDNQLFVNKNLDNKNVPCGVCQASGRMSQLMIPGKISCPDYTWNLEYVGYLMTTADTLDNQSEYVCVDVYAIPYPYNEGNPTIAAHMVHVKGYCAVGSGDIWGCANNEHNREIACAVCSK